MLIKMTITFLLSITVSKPIPSLYCNLLFSTFWLVYVGYELILGLGILQISLNTIQPI
jgi:hypothetical protein